ncbi:MAG: CCA tRNA nucleotidyltransferase, partial [Rhodobacteraceae bacterium]|nr:CCA tRNA nucleotidyltransferase [Paracoccaceae bacterium]
MNICGTWFKAPSAQKIMRLLEGAGHQTYFVGGCVRNDLLGREVKDIDIASAAPPETTVALAKEAGIQAVPTGIKHGTVTLIVDSQSYEITTFRTDLLTDGRHAKVVFSSDLKEDAQRRDFT